MESWAAEVVELWKKNRIPLAERTLQALQQNPHVPVKSYTFEDFIQMVDGTGAMIAEELEARGSDVRDTWLNSVVPGILSQGQPLSALVGQVTMNAIVIYNLLVPLASEEHRAKIGSFIQNWYAKFNTDLVAVGLEYAKGG
ncbi:hypothetical protein [Polyangium spumosum]|uniref:RsbT co-antagonist protein RsbRD N-terminal domain-containing protein n=1 Tax=Polyangium spumosum TaxID=889282 RepID=A0A6N7PRI0_9BACT|nr:hypothetical protein [Polyangium spumosum]MRG94792.1 hypothetical protein [Polyangium spumosum]